MPVDYRTSALDRLKQSLNLPPALFTLMAINVVVFLLYHAITIPLQLFNIPAAQTITRLLALPAYPPTLLIRPWTLLTYMFFHQSIWHILFNLLWFWFFGKLFLRYFSTLHFYALYIAGGLSGALLYILAYNVFPYFRPELPLAIALGASASIMAITLAVVIYAPNEKAYLYGLIAIRLKWLALFIILIDLFSIAGSNAGGHIAHIGGALCGTLFAVSLQRGTDLFAWLTPHRLNATRTKRRQHRAKRTPKARHSRSHESPDQAYKRSAQQEQQRIDDILRKLAKGGYASLSKEEKDLLFKQQR